VYTNGQLTNTRRSDDAPELDGDLREVVRKKILHHHQLYINRPDPIAFSPVVVDTTGRLYDDFSRLLFLNTHRETSTLSNEIPEVQRRNIRGFYLSVLSGFLTPHSFIVTDYH
jgi:hypothetical protein